MLRVGLGGSAPNCTSSALSVSRCSMSAAATTLQGKPPSGTDIVPQARSSSPSEAYVAGQAVLQAVQVATERMPRSSTESDWSSAIRSEVSSEKDEEADLSSRQKRNEENMLHEFKRLGKARESALELCLNKLASLSILPGGYVRHSERIVDLTEEIMLVLRGGQAPPGENARRMLKWSPNFSPAWTKVDCLNLPQVLRLYADRQEETALMDIECLGHSKRKQLSLKRYAQMDRSVFFELFIRSIDEIRQHLPAALGDAPVPQSVKDTISRLASKAAVHACAVHICTSCVGLLHWNKAKHSDANTWELAFAWKALGVDAERCAEIRRVWLQACAAALPDLKGQKRLEVDLRALLSAHTSTSNESFRTIVATVKQLIHSYEKVRGIFGSATMTIFYSILTPYEFGILSAVQLPRTSVQEIVTNKTYPYAQPGKLVELNIL